MKSLCLIVLTALLLGVPAYSAVAQAQAPTKVATVDMKKIFDGYYKKKLASASLENRKIELRKEMKDMADSLGKAKEDYKQMLDQANDPIISAAERDKRNQAAAAKAKEIASTTSALEQFQRQAESQLADQSQRMSGNLVVEIQKAVADKARLGGYTVVINSANIEAFVYVSPDADITDSVLSQLNAGAPIDLSKPSPAAPLTLNTNLP